MEDAYVWILAMPFSNLAFCDSVRVLSTTPSGHVYIFMFQIGRY